MAAALLELGGDALALGVRLVAGRGTRAPAAIEPAADPRAAGDEAARRAAAAEEAAARLDAARERLRATIAPPDDEPSAPADAEAASPARGQDDSSPPST